MLNSEDKFEIACDYYDEETYEKAYQLFLELAEENNVDAQIMVASMLYDGTKIDKNLEKSYSWYKRASDNGHIPSSNFYACYCLDNNNFDEGELYLQKAVDSHNVDAIFNLAIFYLNGQYQYEKNEKTAITLFKQAALLDDMESYLQIWKIKALKIGKKEAYTYMTEEFGLPPLFKMLKYRFCRFMKKIFKY